MKFLREKLWLEKDKLTNGIQGTGKLRKARVYDSKKDSKGDETTVLAIDEDAAFPKNTQSANPYYFDQSKSIAWTCDGRGGGLSAEDPLLVKKKETTPLDSARTV